jgi:hypothetical protein
MVVKTSETALMGVTIQDGKLNITLSLLTVIITLSTITMTLSRGLTRKEPGITKTL